MPDIIEQHSEFINDLRRDAEATAETLHSCFFATYSTLAAENGDTIDLSHSPALKEGPRGYQLDGYAIDLDRGELHVAVSDLRQEDELLKLDSAQIEGLFQRCERFVQLAADPQFAAGLEETSSAFDAAYAIAQSWSRIHRVRFVIFSNARLVSKRKSIESKEIGKRTYTYNVIDFQRYVAIAGSAGAHEPVEIDILDLAGRPLPCLQAHAGEGEYESYLTAVPGKLLATVYGLYGPRLMEQNVRTFLQAKTKVNKGIIDTLTKSPEMFFAFNNGLTATASRVEVERDQSGALGLRTISGLQIVNGGQTTASILYARDRGKIDLSKVYVQMKLSVIEPEKLEVIVPKISKFANTQNKISEADFFSNHPFHLEMEKMSRRLSAPAKPGALAGTKWFYERARGQYKNQQLSSAGSSRKKFEAEFPKEQLIVKTDLAKYALTFDCKPHIVSRHAQKCFLEFAGSIGDSWEENRDQFNDTYYRETIAKVIVFRWTDRMVGESEWYLDDRGYKVQTVTYSLACLVNALRRQGRFIDFSQIWNNQDLDDALKKAIRVSAPDVAAVIKNAPAHIKNVDEYCKREECWQRVIEEVEPKLPKGLDHCTVDQETLKQDRRDGIAVRRTDSEIELDIQLLQIAPKSSKLMQAARAERLLSPKSESAIRKLGAGRMNLSASDRNALANLLARLRERGVEIE